MRNKPRISSGFAALCLLLVGSWCSVRQLPAQTAPTEGIQERDPRTHALVGGRVITEPGRVIENATIVIHDGRITSVGTGTAPRGVPAHDVSGMTVTAGFIELDMRLPAPAQPADDVGRYWNPKVRPELEAGPLLPLGAEAVQRFHDLGFTSVLVSADKGVFAGQGDLVALTKPTDRESILAANVVSFASIEHGGWRSKGHPGSRMGAVSLVRQTFYDATWYGDAMQLYQRDPKQARPDHDASLEALLPVLDGARALAFRAQDALALMKLQLIADEFDLEPWFLGAGDEYEWIQWMQLATPRVVIPLTFPKAPEVERPDQASKVTLRQLERWARAPENPARLAGAGVPFAITTHGLKDAKSEFPNNIRKAIERGLSVDSALAALTTRPAEFAGVSDRLGKVEVGMLAHLTVFDGDPFAEDTRVVEVWVDGVRHRLEANPAPDIRGQWQLTLAGARHEFEIKGTRSKPKLKVNGHEESDDEEPEESTDRVPTSVKLDGEDIAITLGGALVGHDGLLTLAGHTDGKVIRGTCRFPGGHREPFQLARTGAFEPEENDEEEAKVPGEWTDRLSVPIGAYGRLEPASGPDEFVVSGATIWTSGPDGVIEGGDLHIRDGKIVAVGESIEGPYTRIDAEGLHVTPGLIDTHSHTAAIGGINEATQAVTAEVRIGDVLRPQDINIYRQLAGGTTTVQILHGSANPIGGQAAIVKWRWGKTPEELKFQGAPPSIKFALGENVKQSNWGDEFKTRYPQTRMGVDQIMRDRFLAARDYKREWQETDGPRPRRDLELDTLVEILDGKRFIHCHSYRQDEILMLMRLAEDFGFRIACFQHILEGYKVAPEMAKHGATGSSFSDWWAYKFEVYDAIPYNGALMHEAGVVTSFNSDSADLARRMNLEAAKAVKYGGVSREDALKFVTYNAALQLHIEDRVGSLEKGKEADFVIWSGDPLSVYSHCLETWIDGKREFSREEDRKLAERDGARKEELIQFILAEKHRSGAKQDEGGDYGAVPDAGPRECCPKGGE